MDDPKRRPPCRNNKPNVEPMSKVIRHCRTTDIERACNSRPATSGKKSPTYIHRLKIKLARMPANPPAVTALAQLKERSPARLRRLTRTPSTKLTGRARQTNENTSSGKCTRAPKNMLSDTGAAAATVIQVRNARLRPHMSPAPRLVAG